MLTFFPFLNEWENTCGRIAENKRFIFQITVNLVATGKSTSLHFCIFIVVCVCAARSQINTHNTITLYTVYNTAAERECATKLTPPRRRALSLFDHTPAAAYFFLREVEAEINKCVCCRIKLLLI